MITDKCENKIKEIVNSYGADENTTDQILSFLFESGNIYSIAKCIKEDVNDGLDNRLMKLINKGEMISAVKLCRKEKMYDLKTSKDYCWFLKGK